MWLWIPFDSFTKFTNLLSTKLGRSAFSKQLRQQAGPYRALQPQQPCLLSCNKHKIYLLLSYLLLVCRHNQIRILYVNIVLMNFYVKTIQLFEIGLIFFLMDTLKFRVFISILKNKTEKLNNCFNLFLNYIKNLLQQTCLRIIAI